MAIISGAAECGVGDRGVRSIVLAAALLLASLGCGRDDGPSEPPSKNLEQGYSGHAPSRFVSALDAGHTVTVVNASMMPNEHVTNLVIAADRSTRTDCPFNTAIKGLIKGSDIIFVNNHYIAWFDRTPSSAGIAFPAPLDGNWTRGGELAGVWTLDPATAMFRYFRTGPDGCGNWPRNELIPGSASPQQEYRWWDKFAPPVEHSINVKSTRDYTTQYLTGFHYSQQNAAYSGYRILDDGIPDGAGGVVFSSAGMMGFWGPHGYSSDIYDGDDANGVSHYVYAYNHYTCNEWGITSSWKFSPNVSIIANNIYTWIWASYAFDNDGTYCSPAPAIGTLWPGWMNGQVTDYPFYAQASVAANYTSPYASVAVGAHSPFNIGVYGCNLAADGSHRNITFDAPNPTNGTWFGWSSSPSFDAKSPRMLYQHISSGANLGTWADPKEVPVDRLTYGNETFDQTYGGGAIASSAGDVWLYQNQWYRLTFNLYISQ